jgi:hypothetical protein
MTAPEVFLGYIMAARKRFWSWDVSSILRSIIHFFFYIYIFIKLKPKIIKRVNLGFFLIYLDISWVIFNQGEQINHCHLLPRSQAWKLRRVNLESTILEAIKRTELRMVLSTSNLNYLLLFLYTINSSFYKTRHNLHHFIII